MKRKGFTLLETSNYVIFSVYPKLHSVIKVEAKGDSICILNKQQRLL
jgi:hypothetical protein